MSVWVGLRNAIGLALPLALGVAMGQPAGAVIVSLGSLNVAFADGLDPYRQRARRMSGACVVIAAAVFCGALAGNFAPLAVAVAGLWAFGAGMLVTLEAARANLGVFSLAVVVIFTGRPAGFPEAALCAFLALCGGLLQTALALALWPVQRYRPERTVLAHLFQNLATAAASPIRAHEPPPATAQSADAQESLAALDGDHSIESERYRLLLEQAERSRLCLVTLSRLRTRAQREDNPIGGTIDRFLGTASQLLGCIGGLLRDGKCEDASALIEALRAIPGEPRDVRIQMDALSRQLRISLDLAKNATAADGAAFAKREASRPRKLRLRSAWATLRANFSLHSAAMRHAIRLGACVALGDAIGRGLLFQRSYWLPMTIAVILKPDFTGTYSRGLWRLSGTFVGLVLATVLFHFLPPNPWLEVVLIAALTFVLRWAGPANYGLFVVTISALVVLLAAVVGQSPEATIHARALNTFVGGVLALLAYWLWPTWERTRVAEALADLLEAYRRYFHGEMETCFGKPDPAAQDRARLDARLARSNMEASFDRLAAEPGTPPRQVSDFSAMLASSHAFAHAAIALESSLLEGPPAAPGETLRVFARDVERTLGMLAARLRGGGGGEDAPDLRENHRRLVESCEANALLAVEADRITNSLNTLREQVARFVSQPPGA